MKNIYKVPGGNKEFDSKWREKLVAVVVRHREIDAALKERIQKKKIFICQRHFRDDQIVYHESRTSLVPGALPELNLPLHSFQSPPTTPRTASASVASKRLCHQINQQLLPETTPSYCYKSFDEFKKRILLLKLQPAWTVKTTPHCIVTYSDGIHALPKFEIFVNEKLSFLCRVYSWKVPENNELLLSYKNSFLYTTLSNLINCLEKYVLCPGISKEDSCSTNQSFRQHLVQKIFLPFSLHDVSSSSSSPLHQTIFFRSISCSILLDPSTISPNTKCRSCFSLLKQETFSLKRKLSKHAEPAKLNAPIQFTSPD